MQEVNASELRNHLPEYLTRAERGEADGTLACADISLWEIAIHPRNGTST